MAKARSRSNASRNDGAIVGYEAQLWRMADALRGSMDAAEYKHVVPGIIFLKYISDAFEEQHARLVAEQAKGADPEDPDEYRAHNSFWVSLEARWAFLSAQARQPGIDGQIAHGDTFHNDRHPDLRLRLSSRRRRRTGPQYHHERAACCSAGRIHRRSH